MPAGRRIRARDQEPRADALRFRLCQSGGSDRSGRPRRGTRGRRRIDALRGEFPWRRARAWRGASRRSGPTSIGRSASPPISTTRSDGAEKAPACRSPSTRIRIMARSSRAAGIRAHHGADRPGTVGWNPDTGHIVRGGQDLLDTLRTFGSRIIHVHLKDADASNNWQPLGKGVCDIPAC